MPESLSAFLLKPEEAFKLQPTFSAEPSGGGSVGLVAHHAGKPEVLHLRCSFLAQLCDKPLDPWLILSVHSFPHGDGVCFSFLSSRVLFSGKGCGNVPCPTAQSAGCKDSGTAALSHFLRETFCLGWPPACPPASLAPASSAPAGCSLWTEKMRLQGEPRAWEEGCVPWKRQGCL